MDNMYDMLQFITSTNKTCVLATVVNVEGSAYRKEGAMMVFAEDGSQSGLISAGCLEEDLSWRAQQHIQEKRMSDLVVYDMRAEDDLSWGRGAGCNGKIFIRLEMIDHNQREYFRLVKEYVDAGMTVAWLRDIDQKAVDKQMFMTMDGDRFGDALNVSPRSLFPIVHFNGRYNSAGMIEDGQFLQYFTPKWPLVIFGAGPDAESVARLAMNAGFSVKVWDWRPARLKKKFFQGATLLTGMDMIEAIDESSSFEMNAFVMMTHDFQRDKKLLHTLLARGIKGYAGILGPRERTKRLMNGKPIPATIHSPIGLDIGAEGPEEIAISIVAELIQYVHKRYKRIDPSLLNNTYHNRFQQPR